MAVLSHFVGAAAELANALLVNPHDTEAITEALHAALPMGQEQRLQRWQRD